MSIFSNIKHHAVISTVVGVLAVVIAVIAGRAATQKPAADVATGAKPVTVVSVATFREGNTDVSAQGVVQSHSQADLRSQTNAPIALINVSIGDTIYTGQTILELQNADIRAQLDQAKASLALAQGQSSTGAVSLIQAKQAAIDKIRDAYNKTYDAVSTDVDIILYNNDGNGGRLASYISDNKLSSEIATLDIDLKGSYYDWRKTIDSLSDSASTDAIEQVLTLEQTRMSQADKIFDDILQALNQLNQGMPATFATTLNAWKATVSGARTSVSTAAQALTTAQTTLNTANSSQGTTAVAQISLAQAGVSNLQAQLAKTIVTSPITGKIGALPLHVGELASPGTLLATVVGEGGLQVKSYVSGDDLARIQIGAPVTIQGLAKGAVTKISPSLDATNKKVEVDIDITGMNGSGLVVGQNVSAIIQANAEGTRTTDASIAQTSASSKYLVPIQDVKVVPGAAYVFTVDQDSKIKKNDVILGAIQGDFIEVTGGLTPDMNIVTPVYELDEGQAVKVQ